MRVPLEIVYKVRRWQKIKMEGTPTFREQAEENSCKGDQGMVREVIGKSERVDILKKICTHSLGAISWKHV